MHACCHLVHAHSVFSHMPSPPPRQYNATTPIFPEVAAEMQPFLTAFGNPSSTHAFGRPCKAAVDAARARVAALVGCEPDEIYFTSCGTESNNWWAPRAPVLIFPVCWSVALDLCAFLLCREANCTVHRPCMPAHVPRHILSPPDTYSPLAAAPAGPSGAQ
jgi:hypothetical protein